MLTPLRYAAALALFVLAVIYGSLLLLVGADQNRSMRASASVMAGPLCRVMRLRVHVTGAEHLAAGPVVIVGNQQSVLCYCIYAHLFRYLPSMGLFARLTGKWNLPLVTWLIRRQGNFLVDNQKPMRSAAAFLQARTAMQDHGTNVWIGPEGTRGKQLGKLGAFRNGAFRLAVKAQAPIVPAVIAPLKPKTDLGGFRLDPHDVELRLLEPMSTTGLGPSDVTALRDEAQRRMQATFDDLRTNDT